MPVVSKREFRLPDQFGGRMYMKIKFSAKDNMFSIDLPEVMSGILSKSSVYGASIEEVSTNFKNIIKDFEAKSTTTKKMIIIWIKNFLAVYQGEEAKEQDDREICFDFVVANEYRYGDNNPTYIILDDQGQEVKSVDFYNNRAVVIPWTKDKEDKLKTFNTQFLEFSTFMLEKFGPIITDGAYFGRDINEKETKKLIEKTLKG